MNIVTDAELGYLAGLIDGEGCININCVRGRYYTLQVITAQTNERLLDFWKKKTGLGSVHPIKTDRANASDRWTWNCAHNQAEELLTALQPYLVLKSEEARVALEFAKVCRTQQSQFRGRGKPRLTEEMLAVRAVYKETLHALKRQRAGAAVDRPLTVHYEIPEPRQMRLFDGQYPIYSV